MGTVTLGQITGFLTTGSMIIHTTPLAKEQSATLLKLGLEVFTKKERKFVHKLMGVGLLLNFNVLFMLFCLLFQTSCLDGPVQKTAVIPSLL